MLSNKQKRQKLREQRKRKAEKRARVQQANRLKFNHLPVDKEKIVSSSLLFDLPDYYEDYPFTCRDCGSRQLWTAKQQKWWYEVVGGDWESVAIRCRSCRVRERLRKDKARKEHLEGIAKKNLK
ncbi:zinc-ribbon domain containing protein [Rubritalea tangerina]|uniref:Zinc-ribbon domain containing protein n=1 Tax=Rubritalea tangerina TaxID=430798 RepID=A0ABW4ZEU0_9BACT